jgi:nitrate/TMAO reductase-like tetraheme cytochrome c subunit
VTDDQTGDLHAAVSQKRRPRWLIPVSIAAALFVAAAILYVPVYATSTTGYCSSCKEMRVAYNSWERSAHSSVECVECHVPPGRGAALKWRAKETRNIWASYLNMQLADEGESRPENANCIKCHPLEGLMGVAGVVRMPHARHINQNNLMCIDCHDNTSHAGPGESSEVSMRPCTMCHEQTGDPARCSFCHYADPGAKSHPVDFITAHGKLAQADEADCLRCHHDKEQFCDSCHAKPPQGHYTGDWRNDHGQQAEKDVDLCLGCHSYEELCKQCHQVSHPADWTETHPAAAAKGQESCMVCHPRQMCVDCHRDNGVEVDVL